MVLLRTNIYVILSYIYLLFHADCLLTNNKKKKIIICSLYCYDHNKLRVGKSLEVQQSNQRWLAQSRTSFIHPKYSLLPIYMRFYSYILSFPNVCIYSAFLFLVSDFGVRCFGQLLQMTTQAAAAASEARQVWLGSSREGVTQAVARDTLITLMHLSPLPWNMGNRWRPHWRTFVSTISLPHYAFSRHPKNVPHRALELAECHPSRPPHLKVTIHFQREWLSAAKVWKNSIF